MTRNTKTAFAAFETPLYYRREGSKSEVGSVVKLRKKLHKERTVKNDESVAKFPERFSDNRK